MKGYQELNNVVSIQNLPAEESGWSGWLDGYAWARKVVLRVEADQPFDLFVQRRGSDGSLGMALTADSYAESIPEGEWHETDYAVTLGRSFRVGLKNMGSLAGNYKISLILTD